VFAALGLGLALPFFLVAFVPALRAKLPKPGEWMRRLQRILAIPMGLSALAALWLLYRQAGERAFAFGLFAAGAIAVCLYFAGRIQRSGRPQARFVALLAVVVAVAAVARVPQTPNARLSSEASAERWSEAAVSRKLSAGHPVFVYFTADWCLTCKVNEAAAIDRGEVRDAFKKAGVTVLAGDWTSGDPAITRFLESRGRAGVPLYLWYAPGKEPEELPQILTPAMLISRAQVARPGR
jgi:thiol:disulfide interchange protein